MIGCRSEVFGHRPAVDMVKSYWGTDEETVVKLILAGDTVADAELFVLDEG